MNVWYSKDFYLCFLFLIETFPFVFVITSSTMMILFAFLKEPS